MVVEAGRRTDGRGRRETEMVGFEGQRCGECGGVYGKGRLKFRVGRGEAFVKMEEGGGGSGELASPDLFVAERVDAVGQAVRREVMREDEGVSEAVVRMGGLRQRRRGPALRITVREQRNAGPLRVDGVGRLVGDTPLLFNAWVIKAVEGDEYEPELSPKTKRR